MGKYLKKANYVTDPAYALKENEVLKVRGLRVSFKTKAGLLRAVRNVDLTVRRGQIVGLVGESGSGKSVCVKTMLGFNDGGITTAKTINLNGIDLATMTKNRWTQVRGTRVAYIPQDPLLSLNPTKKIKHQILEAIKITEYRKMKYTINDVYNNPADLEQYRGLSDDQKEIMSMDAKDEYKKNTAKDAMRERMLEVLNYIGIRNAEQAIESYPHEFSGGMRQRIVIAIAIVARPDVIIADEPTTALDVTIQAKVLDLIKKLRDDLNISIVFISHNIALVANFCDYIYVMYAGKIVEKGTVKDIFTSAAHPYTWALISSIPDTASEEELVAIPGTPPNMLTPPKGDAFAPRNKYAMKIDFEKKPPFFPLSPTHQAATWLLHPSAPETKVPADVRAKMKIAEKSLKQKAKGA